MSNECESKYKVSVYMTTYFHEKYVAQAIESILSQQVDFKYEIVISDDASTDDTPNIIEHYARLYDFIRVNVNNKNIGLTANVFLVRNLCRGEYLVDLSGDDYWIDNHKLQRQCDFLDNHPEFVGIADRAAIRNGNSDINSFVVPPVSSCNKIFTYRDYLNDRSFSTNGFMFRNIIQENLSLFSIMPKASPYIDDLSDMFLILLVGNVFVSNDISVVYRRMITVKGEHNFNSINDGLKIFKMQISLLNELDKAFEGRYDFFKRYRGIISKMIAKYYRPSSLGEYTRVYREIPTKYRNRFLAFRSLLFIPKKIVELMVTRFSM